MEIHEHFSLAPHTTFAVGGLARYFVEVHSIEELREAFAFSAQKNIPLILIGGGSNMLLDDGEMNALFVHPHFTGLKYENGKLTVGGAESWDKTVEYAVERELFGLENLSGIPGTVGGAVVQNIGAYGAALSETLESVEAYDSKSGEKVTFDKYACLFGYRDSKFKQNSGRYVILSATFALSPKGKFNISYRDLAEHFFGAELSLSNVRDAVFAIRARKFPDLRIEGTAGSFFKNPIVTEEEGEQLQKKYPAIPLFPMPETSGYKVPLAWILDNALSLKGFALGPARCFEQQPLVLVAKRGATARDVRALAREMSERVYAETNIQIEPEVFVMNGGVIGNIISF